MKLEINEKIEFMTELAARRMERAKVAELRVALWQEFKQEPIDADQVLRVVAEHRDAKRGRLSATDLAEFEIYSEFEDAACDLFLNLLSGLTWAMSKELARELAR